jgi:streptogramin lyase
MAGVAKDFPIPGNDKSPGDITVGPDGNLWFAETTGNAIGRITPAGVVTEFPIPTPASFPNAITLGPDNNLWFVEHDGHNIGRITPAGVITEFGIPSGGRPYAITAGSDGNLWFTEPGSFNAIGRCTPAGGISEYPIPTPNTEVAGISAGPDKNLWFAERDANKIGRISNLTGGGNVPSATGEFGTMLSTGAKCTVDKDCVSSGKACGGDVCSHKTATPSCVLSISGDPGWCMTAADCWCMTKGATCDAATHHCSVASN